MSRVLKNLLKVKAPEAAPLSTAAGSHPIYLAAAPSRRPFFLTAGTVLVLIAAALALRGPGARAPASVAAIPGLSDQELFLRNRQAVLGFYNGSLNSSANEMRALIEEEKRRPHRSAREAGLLHANLGAVLLRQGKLTEARTAFVRALAQDPKSPAALHGLGQVALRENELNEAEEHFRLALAAAPEKPEALLSMGQVAELKSDWAQSRGYYKRFLASSTDGGMKAQIAARLHRIEERAPKAKEAE